MKSLNTLYCFGTNCECKNCNKKWVVTYKELVRQQNIKKKAANQYLLGAVGAIGAITTNNRLNKINNTNIANSAYDRANYIDATANMDYLQDKYCPECKSPCVAAERFYYIANNKTYDCVQIISKTEYDMEMNKIYKLRQMKNEKTYHIWTIIFLILYCPIGLVMMIFDKAMKKETKKKICIWIGKIYLYIVVIAIIVRLLSIIFA